MVKRRRGRPKGWKMPEEVKRKIAISKTGQLHSVDTRNKIAKSVAKFFRDQEKVALELEQVYTEPEARAWLREHADELDGGIIRTEKHIHGINKMELQVGDTNKFFGHGFTPLHALITVEDRSLSKVSEYRATNRSKRNSGKDFCNIVL